MSHDRSGFVHVTPPGQASTPREVGVLVVEEQSVIEHPDGVEVGGAQQHRPTAPGEHLAGLVVLAVVALHETTVTGETEFVQLRPDVVDHVDDVGADRDLDRRVHGLALGPDDDVTALSTARHPECEGLLGVQAQPQRPGRRPRRRDADRRTVARPACHLLIAGPIGGDRPMEALVELER